MAEMQIKQLKQKITTLKTQATKFKTFLEEYQDSIPDIIKLNVRFDKFKTAYQNFDDIADRLQILDEETDRTTERFEMEEQFLDLLTLGEQLKVRVISANANTSDGTNATKNRLNKRRVKLPEASLPEFQGRYEDWLSFKDTFTSMIHDQEDLTNIEKLQYLKSALSGEAANKIKNLSMSNDNYTRAWELLEKSYADERIIISRHLSLLLRLPHQIKESAEGLRLLADDAQQHLESLKTLKVNVNEEIVVQILEEKLHKNTAEKWEESISKGKFPKLEEMLEFLYKSAARLSKLTDDKPIQNSNRAVNSTSSQERIKKHIKKPKQTFLTATTKSCAICNENHSTYKCKKFRSYSIPQRNQAAKEASLCLNCLRNHGDKPCTFGPCLICSEKHNTLLHDPKEDVSKKTSEQSSPPKNT